MKLYKKKIKQENIFKNPIIMDKKKKKLSLLDLDGPELLDLQKRHWRTILKQPTCPGLIFLKRQMAGCLPLIIFKKNKVDYLSPVLPRS